MTKKIQNYKMKKKIQNYKMTKKIQNYKMKKKFLLYIYTFFHLSNQKKKIKKNVRWDSNPNILSVIMTEV